jgi:hypothetical protein
MHRLVGFVIATTITGLALGGCADFLRRPSNFDYEAYKERRHQSEVLRQEKKTRKAVKKASKSCDK